MDKSEELYEQMKADKQARLEEYNNTYAEQLRLLGYIKSLENDNEHIRGAVNDTTSGRDRRRAKKLIKINDRDIQIYRKYLSKMPEVPEFK